MSICCGCGKLIDSKFFYCPWCGHSRINQNTEDSIELRYQHYKQLQNERKLQQLEQMENELNQLEEELSVMALSYKVAK